MSAGATNRENSVKISELVRRETSYNIANSPLLFGISLNRFFNSMNILQERKFVNRTRVEGDTSFYLTKAGRDYLERYESIIEHRGR